MTIYIFMARQEEGHFTLDNGKSAGNKQSIDLDEKDLKRPLIKKMIKAGNKNNKEEDRLILAKKPKK